MHAAGANAQIRHDRVADVDRYRHPVLSMGAVISRARRLGGYITRSLRALGALASGRPRAVVFAHCEQLCETSAGSEQTRQHRHLRTVSLRR
jgi:hypothetical protein